jgi:hypothetical protein
MVIEFLLDNLLEILEEVELLLEHLLSSIPINHFAILVGEKGFFKHVRSREHDELEFSTGSGDVDTTIFFQKANVGTLIEVMPLELGHLCDTRGWS